jgi:hypothetical protein
MSEMARGPVDRRGAIDRGWFTNLMLTARIALDQAALALATAGSGHYLPATDNGKPVPDCFVYKIWFGPPNSR